jgi:hypothetical protein
MPLSKLRTVFILSTLLLILLAGCNQQSLPSGGTMVWIDVPLDGLTFPEVQTIQIEGHAASPEGLQRIEVWIDGELLTQFDSPAMEGNLARFEVSWTPPGEGEYNIQAVAYSIEGVLSPTDSARVRFGGPTPTPVPPTDVPTLVPQSEVVFYADPPEVSAGFCADIIWRAEGVESVIFGGIEQPFEGSYRTCPCETEYYTLKVMWADGNQTEIPLELPVIGTCETEDTTPPAAPSPQVPQDGLTLSCRSSQTLTWLPVDDDSGIDYYQVEVQTHSGDNNWSAIGGSPFTVFDKTTNVTVDCGWYYRWRVRAADNAGNIGDWSAWSTFTITLE